MIKFSVRKPMTVFVTIVVIIALGIVSVLKMTPDLIPSIDLPYIIVMTTYPGATPEEVEEVVTKPLEEDLSTLESLKSIQSVSNSNYSMVILEFENETSMDSALVNTLQSVDLIEGSWDEGIGSPYIMKLNPNMMPTTIAAVDMDGYSTEEMSTLVEETLLNKLEGTTGVASISTSGVIKEQLNVFINEDKIDKLNQKLIEKANKDIADARSKINSGLQQINKAQAQLKQSKKDLEAQKEQAFDQMAGTMADLDTTVAQVNGALSSAQSLEEMQTIQGQSDALKEGYKEAEKGTYTLPQTFADAESEIAKAESTLATQKNKLLSARKDLDKAAEEAVEKADLGSMITMDMVSGVLKGQNFDMPAGYIQKDDVKYLVSVGDEISSVKQVKKMFLFNIDGIGDIYLEDVADVFKSDNSDKVYASINGSPSVLLTFSKQSNYATAEVSNNLKDKFESLEKEYEGMHFTILMDQGDYIYLIIQAILESLLYGALFAVLILFVFLRDLKPTFITLLSIPISITFAIVLMYFTGVTINMISLSGLAIAVGMLVDNSIVVIENVYRLRRMGIPAAKAAVAGAKQVAGAIAASTLTTVCVFVPILFTTGIVKQLFLDMALTVGYSLVASLIIAITLVPAMSSMMLRKQPKKESKGFQGLQNIYRGLLRFNLRHKFFILVLAVGLLAYSLIASVSKGFILLPDMSTPQQSGTMVMTDEEATLDDTMKMADRVVEIIQQQEGVETVGAMLETSGGALGGLTGETSSSSVSLYIILEPDTKLQGGEIAKNIEKACEGLDCEVSVLSSSSITSYTSALGGSGVAINVFSTDQDALKEAVKLIGEKLETIEGIDEVDNGLVDADTEYHFTVNKEKAMRNGLTVAQVYMAIADELTYENKATTVNIKGDYYDVVVSTGDATTVKLKDLKNLELDGKDADGEAIKVKVKDIAKVEKTESLSSISRSDQKTYLNVSGTLKEGYNVTLVTQAAEEAVKELELPAGVNYEFRGENETIMDAMQDLMLMMALAVLLVYLIMAAQFQSLKSPFIIMFTIPLAFTGGLLSLIIFDKEISVMAMLGLLLLVGIIVNNGIVLVDFINQLRAGGMSKKDAIVEAGATRMRPVLMTSLTTILGLIVMAIGKTAGTDMMQPIALVCIGGLVYATALTLLVVPVIYDIFNGPEYKFTSAEDVDVSDIITQ